MNKSTIVLLMLAALGLGWLVGASLVNTEETPETEVVSAELPPESTGGAPRFRYIAPGDIPLELDEFGQAAPAALGENFIPRERAWKSETVTVELPLDGVVEYKAIMSQGDTVVFSWATDDGQAYYDFHAHDEAFGDEFFTRYDEGESDGASGAIVAAYDGQHGWFWLNLTDGPMTITLDVAGYYSEIIAIELEGY